MKDEEVVEARWNLTVCSCGHNVINQGLEYQKICYNCGAKCRTIVVVPLDKMEAELTLAREDEQRESHDKLIKESGDKVVAQLELENLRKENEEYEKSWADAQRRKANAELNLGYCEQGIEQRDEKIKELKAETERLKNEIELVRFETCYESCRKMQQVERERVLGIIENKKTLARKMKQPTQGAMIVVLEQIEEELTKEGVVRGNYVSPTELKKEINEVKG